MTKSPLKLPVSRFILVELVGALLIAFMAGLLFRYVFFVSYTVVDESMMPTIEPGDRILSNRISQLISFGGGGAEKGELITFDHPLIVGFSDIKRMIAEGGDTISVSKGKIYVNGQEQNVSLENQIPFAQESPFLDPRLEFERYIIPRQNDTLYLENMGVREFKFAFHLLGQEQPGVDYQFKCNLMLNEKIVSDSNIAELFKLSMDSSKTIDLNSFSWIDLANLEIQLSNRFPKDNISFKHTLFMDDKIIEYYVVKQNNYFVIGDNLNLSYDSRYWGPVNASNITSKPFIVYWSNKPNTWYDVNFGKLLKIVK